MRYAIVIERAGNIFLVMCPICPAVSQPVRPWRKPKPSCFRPSSFTSRVYARTELPHLLRKASSSMCLFLPNPALQGTRRKRRALELAR
jgi:hypothetical protein